jgi:hypothetical protein
LEDGTMTAQRSTSGQLHASNGQLDDGALVLLHCSAKQGWFVRQTMLLDRSQRRNSGLSLDRGEQNTTIGVGTVLSGATAE